MGRKIYIVTLKKSYVSLEFRFLDYDMASEFMHTALFYYAADDDNYSINIRVETIAAILDPELVEINA